MKEIKLGDKFKLGECEWTVIMIEDRKFLGVLKPDSGEPYIWFRFEDADSLNWITFKLTCSKEFVEEMKKWVSEVEDLSDGDSMVRSIDIQRFLSDHTEK